MIGHPSFETLRVLLDILIAKVDSPLSDLIYADIVETAQRSDEEIRVWALSEATRIHSPVTRTSVPPTAGPAGSTPDLHVLVVCVKPTELYATLAAFGFPPESVDRPHDERRGFPLWNTTVPGANFDFNVCVSAIGEGGSDAAVNALYSLHDLVRPRVVVVCAMAAGIRDKVDLGDVVGVARALEYTYGTLSAEGFQSEPKPFVVDDAIARRLEFFDPQIGGRWRESIGEALELWGSEAASRLPSGVTEPHHPRFKVGGMLAGDWKYEAGELGAFAEGRMQGVLGLDMESDGFLRAANEIGLPIYMFRGIADHGGDSAPSPNEPAETEAGLVRGREWQFLSTLAAATAAKLFLRNRTIEQLRPGSGP